MIYLFVGLFGMLGSISRYELGVIAGNWLSFGSFPFGTLLCNLLGCFLLSSFFVWSAKRTRMPAYVRTGIGTGFIGAFTTFSTFSAETVLLLNNHQLQMALSYVFISIIGGLFMSWLGYRLMMERQA